MTRFLRLGCLLGALVASAASAADLRGFYGGIALRENGAQQGVAIGQAGNIDRFTSSLADPRHAQTLVFGGYRWRNDLAVEAAVASVDGYRLSGRGGVGLMLPAGDASRAWNVDVYGSWSFLRRFSLYGRLGYSQADAAPVYSTSILSPAERRTREGLSYGVGLRYDLDRSLGLRLEYARVGTGLESSPLTLPEGDQVQFGLQYRF